MKFHIASSLGLIATALAVAQITVTLPGPGPTAFAVIPYCTVPGYPASPVATGLQFDYDAASLSNCDGSTHQTSWTDSSGNSRTATGQSGTFIICSANQVNGQPAISTGGTANFLIGGSGITGTSEHTVFALWNTSTSDANLLSGNGGAIGYGPGASGAGFGHQAFHIINSASFIGSGTANTADGAWHQVTAQETGTGSGSGFSELFHLDRVADTVIAGSAVGTNGTSPTTILVRQSDGCCFFNGKVGRILYYNVKLSASDIVTDECYLYGKYRI